jgi:hypothetical protein
VIAKRSLIDVPTVLLALGTVLLLLRFKKLQEPVIVGGAADRPAAVPLTASLKSMATTSQMGEKR